MSAHPNHDQAAHHRRRARSLRVLASSIESLPLLQLDTLAGPATWTGPIPADRTDRLRMFQHRLHDDVETLRRRAWWLEQQADELERQAVLPGIA
ncbi:MAG: hypothetical protein AAGG08_09460 [Actinomycetota bacterium]